MLPLRPLQQRTSNIGKLHALTKESGSRDDDGFAGGWQRCCFLLFSCSLREMMRPIKCLKFKPYTSGEIKYPLHLSLAATHRARGVVSFFCLAGGTGPLDRFGSAGRGRASCTFLEVDFILQKKLHKHTQRNGERGREPATVYLNPRPLEVWCTFVVACLGSKWICFFSFVPFCLHADVRFSTGHENSF